MLDSLISFCYFLILILRLDVMLHFAHIFPCNYSSSSLASNYVSGVVLLSLGVGLHSPPPSFTLLPSARALDFALSDGAPTCDANLYKY